MHLGGSERMPALVLVRGSGMWEGVIVMTLH